MPTTKYTPEIPYGYCQCGCGQKTPISDRNRTRGNIVKGEPRKYILGHKKKTPSDGEKALERLWAKVAITDNPNDCWEWKGERHTRGYGIFLYKGKKRIATRVLWSLLNGEFSDKLEVCHKCDNPPCCNPSHLFLGTHADNMHDMFAKGRRKSAHPKGEKNAMHKLTSIQVDEIRKRYADGGITQKALAAEYGVRQTSIYRIVRRIRWRE